jgi:exoribonuclease R
MPRGPKTTKHKNITRIDHPAKRTHGYNVRVAWKGEKHGKFFSDRIYGDRLAALDAAIAWRNKTEKAIGKPRSEHQVVGIHSRNNTGTVGIRRRKRGNVEVFEATWIARDDEGNRKRHTTAYSIARHGEKKAFRLALKARQQGERSRWGAPRIRRETAAEPGYQPWIPEDSQGASQG